MNTYFAYTVDSPDHIYYGKYFGGGLKPSVSCESALLDSIYSNLQTCYSLSSRDQITISILSNDSTPFSDKDPYKYQFVSCKDGRVFLNGTQYQ